MIYEILKKFFECLKFKFNKNYDKKLRYLLHFNTQFWFSLVFNGLFLLTSAANKTSTYSLMCYEPLRTSKVDQDLKPDPTDQEIRVLITWPKISTLNSGKLL